MNGDLNRDWTVEELTKLLISTESTNPGAYEEEMAKLVERLLSQWGLRTKLREVQPGRYNVRGVLDSGDSDEGRRPALVYICHLDTVGTGEGWTYPPFEGVVDDGRLYGRGACDMKGGLAGALLAVREAAKKAKTEKIIRPLIFIGTMDEEGDMAGVQAAVKDGWIREDDWVLDMEPTQETAQMSHRGRAWFILRMKGVTAHASMPEQGADAIAAAAQVVTRMRETVKMLNDRKDENAQTTTITFGQIRGGYSPYVVPDYCELTIDMRLAWPDTMKDVRQSLENICAQVQADFPGVDPQIEVTGDWPAIAENRQSLLMQAVLSCGEKVYERRPEIRPFPGYTDTAVIAAMTGCKNTLSFGPGSLRQAHKPDEYVSVAQLERCRRLYIELALETVFAGR